MWENLYAWEKIRKLESELEDARPRYSVASAGVVELGKQAFQRPVVALSRLTRAVLRGGKPGPALSGGLDTESAPARQPVLDALLEGRGPR